MLPPTGADSRPARLAPPPFDDPPAPRRDALDAERDWLVGLLIDGRYRVVRRVGEGGFGQVFEAFHVGLGAPVALKVPTLPRDAGPEQLAHLVGVFLDEARTLKRLRHPGIVAALDVGFLPVERAGVQQPYMVMEWCSGPSLKLLLDERGGRGLAVAEAWRLFEPLLDALAHAHAEGVAHRDLKPANVVCEDDPKGGPPRPRVIDFGIAKIVASDEQAGSGATRTTSGRSPFTPQYASPEQLTGARTGPWTDVHALALIFVEMVTGRSAVGRDADAMLAVVDPVRPTPGALGVDVGPLEPVLARALAIRPSDRYPDAAALAQAMRSALADLGDAALAPPSRSPPSAPDRSASLTDAEGRTALQTSRTLPTGAVVEVHPVPVARARSALRRLASAAAAAAVACAALAAQHHQGGWPFRPRLRDLSSEELDRRSLDLGLGACSSAHASGTITVACERGTAMLMHLKVQNPTPEALYASANSWAMMYEAYADAVRFAVDGDVALALFGPRAGVETAWPVLIHGLRFERSGEPKAPPPPERSGATTLAAWTGADLAASVSATGARVASADTTSESPFVMVTDHGKIAHLYLTLSHGPQMLATLRPSALAPFVYALDGDVSLTAIGDPAFASVDYLCRLLAGTRAAEVGVRRLSSEGALVVERHDCQGADR